MQVHCHDDVINMLLDNGADVNKLNVEGMSALAFCMVLYYPLQSLHETLAEKVPRNISPEPQVNNTQVHYGYFDFLIQLFCTRFKLLVALSVWGTSL